MISDNSKMIMYNTPIQQNPSCISQSQPKQVPDNAPGMNAHNTDIEYQNPAIFSSPPSTSFYAVFCRSDPQHSLKPFGQANQAKRTNKPLNTPNSILRLALRLTKTSLLPVSTTPTTTHTYIKPGQNYHIPNSSTAKHHH